VNQSINQSINQSKHTYIAPCVASESEDHVKGDKLENPTNSPVIREDNPK